MNSKAYTFCLSKQIELPFQVKIGSLEGHKKLIPLYEQVKHPEDTLILSNIVENSDLFVTVQIFADGEPLTIPANSSYTPFRTTRKWGEWIPLPIFYSQLPFNAQLAITIWEFAGPGQRIPYGGTTVSIFDPDDCTLRTGRQKLKVWLGQRADGSPETATPGIFTGNEEVDRIEKLIKKQESMEIPRVPWLDNLAFRRFEQINKLHSSVSGTLNGHQDTPHYLLIDLAQFGTPIVYSDSQYTPPVIPVFNTELGENTRRNNGEPTSANTNPAARIQAGRVYSSRSAQRVIHDPDQFQENPIELKYRRLERSHQNSSLDREVKPNAKVRDELNEILNFPPVQELTGDEKYLVWKFRYYLSRDKRGLTKFLKSVTWEDKAEVSQALELLNVWTEIDVADALELLGPTYRHRAVRSYAVNRLRKAGNEEIQRYLLQLVQALGFEEDTIGAALRRPSWDSQFQSGERGSEDSPLASFLISRSVEDKIFGSFFYWYVKVEAEDKGADSPYATVLAAYIEALRQSEEQTNTNQLVELEQQCAFVDKLVELAVMIRSLKDSTPKKIEKLRSVLAESEALGLKESTPVQLPLDPRVSIVGTVPEKSFVFKSSLNPLKLCLKTSDGNEYHLMFKHGDDLRQDQLVIQVIVLMDALLKNENLDLKLSPYSILATSPTDGALQFVPNKTLASVLAEYPGGILEFLREKNPDSSNALGVKSSVLDTYIKSCAGYCVITYLLGVGDRHLDNLLICSDGHFFHADFGYILGRDPKPFPPMMKLPIQIIDGMGGTQHPNYDKFRSYCFTAFTTLRKSSNLILNLFSLMTSANIPDIKVEPDKVVMKVKEKFCLEMTEEEAIAHFQNLINDSVNAFLPMVIDRLHNLTQYWRA